MGNHVERTLEVVRAEYGAACEHERSLKFGSAEWKAYQPILGALWRELCAFTKPKGAAPAFTAASYREWPDSFEAMRRNRNAAKENQP